MTKWNLLNRVYGGFCGLIMAGMSLSLAHAETLNAVIQESLATNPKVLAAKESRLSVDQAVVQARAGFYPQIKATALYGPEHSKNANTIASVITGSSASVNMPVREIGVTLDQMVFDGFATQGEVYRNIARVNSAAYTMLAAMQDTALATAQAYLDVLREQKLVAIAERNANAHRRILHTIKLRTDRGLSNEADHVQVQGRLALAESNLYAEKSNLQDAIARYKLAVGDYPGTLVFPGELPASAFPKTEEEAIEFAGRYNPVVRSAQADLQATFQQHEVAKAKNYPRFDIQLGIDRNSNVGGVRGPDDDQFAFAKVSYDLFSGGAIWGRQKETEHIIKQAREIMLNAYRQAQQDTKFAWDSLVAARRLMPYLKEHSFSTVKIINAYNEQFTLSKRTLLDLLDVQGEYYAAEKAYLEGEYKIILSQYQILHHMGLLVQTLNTELPLETYIYVVR